jgi:hypothetical protein
VSDPELATSEALAGRVSFVNVWELGVEAGTSTVLRLRAPAYRSGTERQRRSPAANDWLARLGNPYVNGFDPAGVPRSIGVTARPRRLIASDVRSCTAHLAVSAGLQSDFAAARALWSD